MTTASRPKPAHALSPAAAAGSAHSWLALPLLALPALWPLLARGLTQGHDLPNHLMRLAAFDQAVRAGQWYPRWLPDLALGYGYPLYNYYAPGSVYGAELFVLLGLSAQHAIGAWMGVALLVAALGMWRLAADFFPARSPSERGALALVAATAYLYAPYLLTNVYVRGAIAELGAQALLPWALWSVRRLLLDPRPARWAAPAALSVGGLAVMHNLSLLFVAPLLAAVTALHLWRAPDRGRRLAWAAVAGAVAVGLSAFYWWPLLGERAFLPNTIETLARQWLPGHMWTWPSFLDASLVFRYHPFAPFGLGLAQVALAVAGLRAARRWWRAEWLLLALVAGGAGVLMGRPWQALWLNSLPLLVVQFPWRLLTLVSIVLALFTAGSLLAARTERQRWLLAGLLLGVIIVTQRPRLSGVVPLLPADLPALGAAHVAQFESQTGSLGATTNFQGVTSDFMPRWVDQAYGLTTTPGPGEHLDTDGVDVRVSAAAGTATVLTVVGAQPFQLRLSTFYFPGWLATLDGEHTLTPYPTTPLGLLTLDVPAGEHTLVVGWVGTPLQNVAAVVSMLTLAGLALVAWRLGRTPILAGVLGAITLLGVAAWLPHNRAPLPLAAAPTEALAFEGTQLAGYIYRRSTPEALELRPYWFVRRPVPGLNFHWQLSDAAGQTVAETRTQPFFDTVPTTSWRAGTLVDDAYRLGLPGGLPAGEYTLAVCAAAEGECAPQRVGLVVLAEAVPAEDALPALTPLEARFGDDLTLAGYGLDGGEARAGSDLVVARPGEGLAYTLYWRARRPLGVDYHAFVQLADASLDIAARQDGALGPPYWPPRLWDTHTWQPDAYTLEIPADTPNGVYWPHVGVYDLATVERLTVRDAAGAALGDSLRLPPVKVLGQAAPLPAQTISARFEGTATLRGYDLSVPSEGVRPGSTLTVTLYFRAEQAGTRDLTRFVHLASEAHGLAAQADGVPQAGRNPTWAWLPDEMIVDTVVVTVDPNAIPGEYALRLGLYDPAAEGARLAVFGADGQALPDNQVVVTTVNVAP